MLNARLLTAMWDDSLFYFLLFFFLHVMAYNVLDAAFVLVGIGGIDGMLGRTRGRNGGRVESMAESRG